MMKRTIAIGIALAAFALTAGGCLITADTSVHESGTAVGQSTLRQIEPGVTTEAWVLATLGDPTERTVVEGQENTAVLRYDHTVRKYSDGTVFLLFSGESDTKRTRRTFFEITDGVVSRYWTED
jgi:hypothetical protein